MKNIKIFNLAFCLVSLVIFNSCQKEWDFPYPLISTIDIKPLNDTSAIFTGEIINLGSAEIIEYGYVIKSWTYSYFPYGKNDNTEGQFTMLVSSVLRPGVNIGIRAYAKTSKYTIMGNSITYNCTENVMPEIISIVPISANKTVQRTLTVKNFCEAYSYSITLNNGQYVISDKSVIDPNTIVINLPSNIEPGSYTVYFYNYGLTEYSEEIIVTSE